MCQIRLNRQEEKSLEQGKIKIALIHRCNIDDWALDWAGRGVRSDSN